MTMYYSTLLAFKTLLMRYDKEKLFEAAEGIKAISNSSNSDNSVFKKYRDLEEKYKHIVYFVSQAHPDFRWSPLTVVTTACDNNHEDPVPDCTCGVHSSYSLLKAGKEVRSRIRHNNKLVVAGGGTAPIPDLVPVTAVIQVLGHTEVDTKEGFLRSWGGFLWGIIKPYWMEEDEFSFISWLTSDTYAFAAYSTLEEAWIDVRPTLCQYKLFIGDE